MMGAVSQNYDDWKKIQLLEEEKWLVKALAAIRKQRNCFQIERLHLEGLKSKLLLEISEKQHESKQTAERVFASSGDGSMQVEPPNKNILDFDVPLESETACNQEELNLNISKSIFGQADAYNMEEYDEEDACGEDVVIDINMLMNGEMEDDLTGDL